MSSSAQLEMIAVAKMREIAKLPENCRCADCDSKDPDWTSINLGIFICIKCAGIHRNLGVHHSKVRSIELDTSIWTDDMIAFMKKMGNERARNLFEKRAPVFYIRPKEYDLAMVRERWIRAKYEKRLFVKEDEAAASSASAAAPAAAAAAAAPASAPSAGNERTASASMSVTSQQPAQSSANRPAAMSMGPSSSAAASSAASAAASSSSSAAAAAAAAPSDPAMFWAPERATEGWLFKENKKQKWQKRWFQLWGRELHYFKDAGDSYEKGRIDVVHAKILIPDGSGGSSACSMGSGTPGPEGHKFLFELVSTEQDRAYPLAAETEEEMFAWLHAIRRAIIFYSAIASGAEEKAGMVARVADTKTPFARLSSVVKKGMLSKQGGGWASWNKRFFVLAKDVLYYYKNQPADVDLPEGGICLDAADIQYGEDKLRRKFVFCILTPDRTYFIQASGDAEMQDWMAALKRITDTCQKRRMVDFADPKLR